MSIKGEFQAERTNDYGYTAVKVSGTWYGADKKNYKPQASEGDTVEFEAFEKAGKDGRTFPTYKCVTFRKLASSPGIAAQPRAVAGARGTASGSRDTYWTDKAKSDADKDPRIAYFAAYERALAFVDLALRNGAVASYEKAKATSKLEILEALVGEQSARIMAESYAAKVPSAKLDPTAAENESADDNGSQETEEEWS